MDEVKIFDLWDIMFEVFGSDNITATMVDYKRNIGNIIFRKLDRNDPFENLTYDHRLDLSLTIKNPSISISFKKPFIESNFATVRLVRNELFSEGSMGTIISFPIYDMKDKDPFLADEVKDLSEIKDVFRQWAMQIKLERY